MEFVVPGVDAFIDLSRSYFTLKLRLRKQNGTDLADGELLYPANNLAHTLINQLTCHLNGTLISPQNDSYAYKAYLETVLNYSEKEGHTLLRLQGWFPTQHEMMTTGLDFPTPLTANKRDDATQHAHYAALSRTKKAAVLLFKQEQVPYQGGAVRTLAFKPHSELFHLNNSLVPGVEIKLRFAFNSPDFFLNGVALHGRLTPQDLEMTFHLCQLTLSAPLYKTLDTARHNRREVAEMWGGAGCCTLFMFDNVPNGAADSTLMNPRQDGDLRIRFKLGAAVNHVINVLLYAEFENVLEIDGNGAVIYNI